MLVHLVNELVEVILVAGAQIYEGLHGLIGVCRNFLPLTSFDGFDGVIGEHGEVGNTVVNVCGFVYTDKRFVEDGEQIPEELQRGRLEVRQSFISEIAFPSNLLLR